MAQLTSTTTPGMQQAAGAMQNASDITRNGVNTVQGETQTLWSVWAGEAGSSFDYAMQAWVSDCQAIDQALRQMVELLQGNAVVITKGEASNSDAAAQVHKVMGMHL
jgi:WXG100 family type VII secretion target